MEKDEDYLRRKMAFGETFSDEECMWLAYYESLKSRADSDHPAGSDPFVGAVIRGDDQKIKGISHRANGQEGDHAEKSLLVGQLDGMDLAGCTLYTTLEPCTPNVRNELSCSELIAKSAIRRAFVGILDPNPQVYSKGLSFLFSKGFEVHPFLNEINQLILKSCPAFSKAERGKQNEIQRVIEDVIIPDFDQDAVRYFEENSEGVLPNDEALANYLLDKNYVSFERKKIWVDPQVKLMFNLAEKQPSPSAKIFFCDLRMANGREQKPLEYQGPVALALKGMTSFLSRFSIEQGTELYGVIKEAFANAILHREYFKANSYVYLSYDGFFFQVRNPVSSSFSEEKIKEIAAFTTAPEPGNPILVDLAHFVHFIDVQGKGLLTLKALKPQPEFQIMADRILNLKIKSL